MLHASQRCFHQAVLRYVALASGFGILCCAATLAQVSVSPAFTYQGQIRMAGNVLNGTADLQFTLFDAATLGSQVGTTQTVLAANVVDGLFTAQLDFGAAAYNGNARWVEIAVRSPAGSGTYSTLTPRQPLTATPYSRYAVEAYNGGDQTGATGLRGVLWSRSSNGTDVFIGGATSAGLGLSSPASRLHVRAPFSAVDTARFDDNLSTSQLRILTPQSSGRAELQAWNLQTNAAGNLTLQSAGGNVGIGTITPHPSFRLQTTGGSGAWRGAIAGTGPTNSFVAGELNGVASVGGHNAALSAWANLAINPGGGNVGIGTSTPGSRLDVAGSLEADAFRLNGNGAAAGRVLVSDASGNGTWQASVGGSQWTTNGADIGYLGGGNVGIGTASPNMTLDVPTFGMIGTSVTNVSLHDVANRTTKVSFGYMDSGSSQFSGMRSIVVSGTNGCGNSADIRFDTWECNTAFSREVMRITGGGEVGIGTMTPASKLDVAGTITADGLDVVGTINSDALLADVVAAQSLDVSGTTNTIADIESSSTIGTWLSLRNFSAGGRFWQFISTGSGNGGGVGNLLIGNGTSPGVHTTAIAVQPDGDVGIGTLTPAAKLDVIGTARVQVLTITGGSDVAEPFNINVGQSSALLSDEAAGRPSDEEGLTDALQSKIQDPKSKIEPGMIVSIDPDAVGELRISSKAYDKTVAGIISGANGVKPGMVLTQEGSIADGKHPVALTGRVWAWCDADAGGEIVAGDMLTTSSTPGHAMRVGDHDQANGAVIGKAMSSLKSGKGMVLVLVNLQ